MQISFHGSYDTEEAIESLLSILKLFRERYGISYYNDMQLTVTLKDKSGEELELVDVNSQEVLSKFEVHKTPEKSPLENISHKHLRLVVDNTSSRK